ncbi:hypothetical protein [Nocardioides sambongensis]|uniref:hypothetical protein n=1 Tax=Nocardioides sambongensis TaxID=2589074 RepID=UPI00112BD209|nr:hypothetical protein [Nocardioides sambongensis]
MRPDALLEAVARWEVAGGTWRLSPTGPGAADVVLCRCDGGEEVERLACTDPGTLTRLRRRSVEPG